MIWYFCKRSGGKARVQIFAEPVLELLTRRGMEFYEKAQELVKGFDVFRTSMPILKRKRMIASQHYDFLPPTITTFLNGTQDYKNFRIFESTTVQILDEIAQGHSEVGLFTSTIKAKRYHAAVEKVVLKWLSWFLSKRTFIYVRAIPWLERTGHGWFSWFANSSFTQERMNIYYSENFVDTSASSQMFNATLMEILERTNLYATGSGFLDSDSVAGITVIPLNDNLNNRMVMWNVRSRLEPSGNLFVEVMQSIFNQKEGMKKGIIASS